MAKQELTLSRVYGGTLAPIEQVKALIVSECDPAKLSKFVDAMEAAKKRDSKTLERKNYWGELSIWSRRRLGELIKISREDGTLAAAGDNQHTTRGVDSEAIPLSAIGIDHKQAQRAQRIAEIPEEDIKEYIAAVNFDDVVADDLIQTDRMKKWRKRNEEEVSMAGLLRFTNGKAGTHAHVSLNTGVPEWYTPVEYIEAARSVMGEIDLDPATSAMAQKTVRANQFFTAKQNGLTKEWAGRVWLNPPYSSDACPLFVDKLCSSVESKAVPEAFLLVNNATETKWFQKAAKVASAVCFPAGRIKFIDDEGKPGAPLQGQAVLYFGGKIKTFCDTFASFGFCVKT
jgi:ParB family chromosome partitioning protein